MKAWTEMTPAEREEAIARGNAVPLMPPDSRTVNPGQSVTYHQTESRPVKVAWAQPTRLCEPGPLEDPNERIRREESRDRFVTDSPAPVKVARPSFEDSDDAWRNAAIRSVLLEHRIVDRANLSEIEFDNLVDGLMIRLDDPATWDKGHAASARDNQHEQALCDALGTNGSGGSQSDMAGAVSEVASVRRMLEAKLIGTNVKIDNPTLRFLAETAIGRIGYLTKALADKDAQIEANRVAWYPQDVERRLAKIEAYVEELRGNRDVHAKVIAELVGNPGVLYKPADAQAQKMAQLRFGTSTHSIVDRGPAQGDADQERRIVGIECQLTELRTDRDTNSKAMVDLTERYNQLADRLDKLECKPSGLSDQVEVRRGRELDMHVRGDGVHYWLPRPIESGDYVRWTNGTAWADGEVDRVFPLVCRIKICVPGQHWTDQAPWVGQVLDVPMHQVRRVPRPDMVQLTVSDRPLQPGDIWRDPEGTEYVVVRAAEVHDRPRWFISADAKPDTLSLRSHRGLEHGAWSYDARWPLALVLADAPATRYPEDLKLLIERLAWNGMARSDFQRVLLGMVKENAKEIRQILGLPSRPDVVLWSSENRPMQPGDVWVGPDGTEYVAVTPAQAEGRPHWWVGPSTAHWPEVPGDLHLGDNTGGWPLALVLRNPEPKS